MVHPMPTIHCLSTANQKSDDTKHAFFIISYPFGTKLCAMGHFKHDTVCHGTFHHKVIVMFCDVYSYLEVKIRHRNCKQIQSVAIQSHACDDYVNSQGNQPSYIKLCLHVAFFVSRFTFKVAQHPGFLRLTNLEIHAGRLFAFLIC